MSKNKNKQCNVRKTSIGGQALMEGIMMRGPKTTAMAVRNTDGEIIMEKFPTRTTAKNKFFRLPVIRGVFNFVDSMVFGTKCLMRSAEISGLEEVEEEMKKEKEAKKAAKAAKKSAVQSDASVVSDENSKASVKSDTDPETQSNTNAGDKSDVKDSVINEKNRDTADVEDKGEKNDKPEEKKEKSVMMSAVMVVSLLFGFALAIGLFIILPSYLYKWSSAALPFLAPENEVSRSFIKSVFEGVIKIALLVGYMSAVSLMKDIRRTFMYHGAEHKTIFCYEHGLELTVENVRKQKRFHPRCGTSFLILMLLVSIFISFFIDPLFIAILGYVPHTIFRVLLKLLLLPITVGIGYELIKLAGRHDNLFTKIISAPGLGLQHLTVFEPDDDMIECAICAIKEVIPDDGSDKW